MPGFTEIINLKHFAGGQSNPTYLISAHDGQYVLRSRPEGALLPSAHAIDREYRILTALEHSSVPVPSPIAYCDSPSVIGNAFYLMSYVEGRIFWDASLPEVPQISRAAIYNEMTRVQAVLHSQSYDALGLSSFGKPNDYIARQVARWTEQYRKAETERIEPVERLINWLPQHIPSGNNASIVHGDYRLDNAIFHPTEPRILAILDWELSTIGHSLVDFSYFCMRYYLPAAGFRGLADADLNALCIPSEVEIVEKYCAYRGIGIIPSLDYAYYLTFSMFRLIGILQGVFARALQGNAASPDALERGRRVAPLANVAWALVEERFG